MVHTVRILPGQRVRVVDIGQSKRSSWYKSCSEMSTLQSPVLIMSKNVKNPGLVEELSTFSKNRTAVKKKKKKHDVNSRPCHLNSTKIGQEQM